MNPEQAFDTMGVDAITGVKIMNFLDLSMDEMRIPQNLYKMQDIIKFLKPLSEDTQRFLIERSVSGKPVDKLKYFHEYIQLLDRKESLRKDLENISRETGITEVTGEVARMNNLIERSKEVKSNLDQTEETIKIYEK